jgi:tRNA dimethylallyltransferase
LARQCSIEVVSVDSMQVYRGMDIGTAKPGPESLRQVPHHMIDVVNPEETFNVGEFRRMALEAIDGIRARGRRPLLVCGAPMYLKALLWGLVPTPGADPALRQRLREEAAVHGTETLHRRLAELDPAAALRISPNDLRRIERALEVRYLTGQPISAQQGQFDGPAQVQYVAVGLRWPRQALYERIERRVDGMMASGLLDEVRGLEGRLGPQAGQAVGYKELLAHLRGETTMQEAIGLVKRNTRRLAKHQMTWFRRFPAVEWLDMPALPDVRERARQWEGIVKTLTIRRRSAIIGNVQ